MANANAIVLKVPEPTGDPLWSVPALRDRYYRHAAETARSIKLRSLRKGKSVTGKPLAPVKITSRPDGAKGPPLSPHQAESRSQKWLRVSVGMRAKTITLHWPKHWAEILRYHAEGEGRYGKIPVRDVIGFSGADQRAWEADLARFWKLIRKQPAPPAPAHLERAPGPPRGVEGLTFVPSVAARNRGDVTVTVDLVRVMADLARDRSFHVGPGGFGAGAKPGAYGNVMAFLARARTQGLAVEMPRLTIGPDGVVAVIDGRHRLAALRALGATKVPVTTGRADAAKLRAKYGVGGSGPEPVRYLPAGAKPNPRSRRIQVFED